MNITEIATAILPSVMEIIGTIHGCQDRHSLAP